MASLSEMMAYSDWTGRNSPQGQVAGNIAGGIEGFMAGQESAKKIRQQQLENTLKILDIQEKIQKMKLAQRQQELGENFAKAAGLMPMSEHENAVAVNAAFNSLGGETRPVVNTAESKIGKMFREGKLRASWSTKSGFTVSVADKNSTGRAMNASTAAAMERLDLAQAEKMARSEMEKNIPKDVLGNPSQKAKDIQVPPDMIMKYYPIATAIRTRDTKRYAELMRNIKKPKDEPMQNMLSQIADLNAKLTEAQKPYTFTERIFGRKPAATSETSGEKANMERRKKFERPLPENPDKTDIWGNVPLKDETETDTETDDPDL